ncbi:MAG: ABC transporter substrate-binding protein [Candidatus Heimdallarchaeota archaeon]
MQSNFKQVGKGILLLSVFLLGIFFVSGCIGQEEVEAKHPLDGLTIEVGVIQASSITENERIATEVAAEEVNAYVKTLGIDVTFVPLFEATEGRTALVVEKFDTLMARDVKFILGLWWSSSVRAIIEKANEQKIVVISGASTAMDLAIPDDFIFRMPVTDEGQGPAIASMIRDYGIEAVICTQRADTWADGLYGYFEERWVTDLGFTVHQRIRYDPEKTEFGAEAELLDGYIAEAKAQYGDDKVGVLHLGFTVDTTALQASVAEYPGIMNTPWFGSDGHAQTADFIREQGTNAVKIKHVSTLMGISRTHDQYYDFAAAYTPRYGAAPGTYEACQYDSFWLIAKAILEAGSVDTDVVRQALPTVAAQYFGASGWTKFNTAGDRQAANFDVWAVVYPEESLDPEALYPDANSIGWEIVGFYDVMADSTTWFVDIPIPLG